jgi:4-amino-4-deoxy-L-arabinose transferase-like glycosyltransferase
VLGVGLFALALRLPGLRTRGLLYWDEGLFLMGARFLRWLAAATLRGEVDTAAFAGFPTFVGKPGHVVLLALAGGFGPPAVLHGLALSVVCSLVTLILVHRLGRDAGGGRAGWFAAVLLAASPYYLVYSRSVMHECSSVMITLLGVWLFLRARKRGGLGPVAAGAVLGAGIAASYRWLIVPPLVVIADALVTLEELIAARGGGGRGLGRGSRSEGAAAENGVDGRAALWRALLGWGGRAAMMGLGIVGTFLAVELLYRFAFTGFERYTAPSYFKFLRLKLQRESGWNLAHLDYYPRLFVMLDGVVSGLLAVAGLFVLAVRRRPTARTLLVMLLLGFVIFALTSTRLARTITLLLPLLAISAGVALDRLWARGRAGRWIVALLLVGVAAHQVRVWARVIGMRSGYEEASRWIRERSDAPYYSTMMPISAFMEWRGRALYPPPDLEAMLRHARERGIRFLLVDWQRYVWYHGSIERTERRCRPVHVVDNPYVSFPTVLRENYLPADVPILEAEDPTLALIRIYDLRGCYPGETAPGGASAASAPAGGASSREGGSSSGPR